VQDLRAIVTPSFGKNALLVLRVDSLLNQSDISNNEKTSETKQ
jgi:hypothetical protein